MRFSTEARQALMTHRWPGNIRELVAAMTHAGVLSKGTLIDVEALPDDLIDPPSFAAAADTLRSLADVERERAGSLWRTSERRGPHPGDRAHHALAQAARVRNRHRRLNRPTIATGSGTPARSWS